MKALSAGRLLYFSVGAPTTGIVFGIFWSRSESVVVVPADARHNMAASASASMSQVTALSPMA